MGESYTGTCATPLMHRARPTSRQTRPDKATVRALLERAVRGPYGAAFWLLAYSGMRRGEVAAIKREHLDLDNSTVSVVGAVGRQAGQSHFGNSIRNMIMLGHLSNGGEYQRWL